MTPMPQPVKASDPMNYYSGGPGTSPSVSGVNSKARPSPSGLRRSSQPTLPSGYNPAVGQSGRRGSSAGVHDVMKPQVCGYSHFYWKRLDYRQLFCKAVLYRSCRCLSYKHNTNIHICLLSHSRFAPALNTCWMLHTNVRYITQAWNNLFEFENRWSGYVDVTFKFKDYVDVFMSLSNKKL